MRTNEAKDIEELTALLAEVHLEAKARVADYIGDLGAPGFLADMRQIQACASAAAAQIEAGGTVDTGALLALIGDKAEQICLRLKNGGNHAARA